MPSIAQAIKEATQTLAETSDSARLDAEVLLCHVLNCTATHLIAWPEKQLDIEQTQTFHQLIEQRHAGTPVAYLTGSREFWSLNFKVTPATLIPRPETETLVEFVLDKFSAQKNLKMVDLGTGSGAIAIAIASERPDWEIIASDISKEALSIATENARIHQISNIQFIESNWFEQLDQQRFDLIISNPPYIAEKDQHLSQGDVRFEPPGALSSGKTGMDDIKHITAQSKKHLNPNGWLAFEHGYDQNQPVSDCFNHYAFQEVTQLTDLSGQARISAGKYKHS
ncbi:MAG: peptide chain release factor N(5)-glutamine methyltransferase [Gammaproteobacteria bacterium]|nr:peptide chain release factor N(5)-glutamine methyltransferase [Gammaproteobacteria bacterium]MDH5387431.1 peptide chain release factor N(5)-glutamine methyltransferase [Gammaproteobacteria bacterium]